jgi:hypothetical protein
MSAQKIRTPSMLLSLLPIAVLILLLTLNVK